MPVAGSLVMVPLLALGVPALAAEGAAPVDVVVTAAPPVDGQRLADAMRAYLDGYGIRVESATPAEGGDLRRQIAEARRIGQAVRAMAVVRAQKGGVGDGLADAGDGGVGAARGTIEIEIIDLATDKVLIAEVPRPRRDEDLYRALALKIEATLRATLSEAPERLGPRAGLTRLALSGQSQSGAVADLAAGSLATEAAPARVSIETGYLLLAFPLGGVQLQGLSLAAAFAPRPWLELALGGAVLESVRAEGSGVVAVGTVVPLAASARLRLAGARVEGLAGPTAGLSYVSMSPSSPSAVVVAQRHLVPALGVELEGRLRVRASTPAWIYARAAGLGVLLGERYTAAGQVLVDTSRFQASLSIGLGVGL
jgi:hypothetical protein